MVGICITFLKKLKEKSEYENYVFFFFFKPTGPKVPVVEETPNKVRVSLFLTYAHTTCSSCYLLLNLTEAGWQSRCYYTGRPDIVHTNITEPSSISQYSSIATANKTAHPPGSHQRINYLWQKAQQPKQK